jgi:hypothetical protein
LITYVCVDVETIVPYPLDRLLAFSREEPTRANQEDEDDRREQKRGQVLALVGRQRTA